MHFNGITRVWLRALFLIYCVTPCDLFSQSTPGGPPPNNDMKVAVFFGATRALDVGEIRTNAMVALRQKGYAVPPSSTCVINVSVLGPKPGCTVIFWDLRNKWKYQVEFNGQGKVSGAWAGAMRHGTVGPSDPLPEVPPGGVKVGP